MAAIKKQQYPIIGIVKTKKVIVPATKISNRQIHEIAI